MFKFLSLSSFFSFFKRTASVPVADGVASAQGQVKSRDAGDFALRFSGVRYNGSRYNGGRYTGGRYCRRS